MIYLRRALYVVLVILLAPLTILDLLYFMISVIPRYIAKGESAIHEGPFEMGDRYSRWLGMKRRTWEI